jgi:hypothetical protein
MTRMLTCPTDSTSELPSTLNPSGLLCGTSVSTSPPSRWFESSYPDHIKTGVQSR